MCLECDDVGSSNTIKTGRILAKLGRLCKPSCTLHLAPLSRLPCLGYFCPQQVAVKDAELSSMRSALASSQAMVTRQQSMILDQHTKLELQAQVRVRAELGEIIDNVGLENISPRPHGY